MHTPPPTSATPPQELPTIQISVDAVGLRRVASLVFGVPLLILIVCVAALSPQLPALAVLGILMLLLVGVTLCLRYLAPTLVASLAHAYSELKPHETVSEV